jgi:cholesterol oxidase
MAGRFDVVVVGSGFGGSVVAYRMAQAGLRVCLLERGRSWPPGSFPRAPRAMRDNFWDPSEGLHGMFDLWSFDGLEAVVASGLGGGSLIYANVLLRKDASWFPQNEPLPDGGTEHWPLTRAELDPHYAAVESVLTPAPYPFDHQPYARTPKTLAMQEAARRAGSDWGLPPLAVTFAARPGARPVPGVPIVGGGRNLHGRPRLTCRLCGECDVGCNDGAKNTLDLTYLSLAAASGNADIRPCCEVKTMTRLGDGQGFRVGYVEHFPERRLGKVRRDGTELRELRAQRVVLCAGALGSTYLLLRNRHRLGPVSARLGHRFNGNGDLLGFARVPKGAAALDPSHGPVITSAFRLADEAEGGAGRGAYVQEGGYPPFAAWAWEGAQMPGLLRRAARFAWNRIASRLQDEPRSDIGGEVGGLLGDRERSWGALPMLAMGRDLPDGRMGLRGRYLAVDWRMAGSKRHFDRVDAAMAEIAGALGGSLGRNPLGRLRRVVTVHPLGGCPMGVDEQAGVIDSFGRVFHQPGLYVADGAAMPGPVGANPSLTIAAFADRVAEGILGELGARS